MRARDWQAAGGCLLDVRGRVMEADQAICGFLHLDRAHFIGTSFADRFPAEDGLVLEERIAALGEHGTGTFAAMTGEAAVGAIRVLVTLSVFGTGEARCVGAFVREAGPAADVVKAAEALPARSAPEAATEIAAETATWPDALLKEALVKLQVVFERTGDAMAIVRSSDGFILDANFAFGELLGYRREEMVGRTTVSLGISVDPSFRPAMLRQLLAEGSVRDLPWEARTRSGERRETLHSAYLIDGGAEPTHVAVIRDVTEARLRERALAESEAKFSAAFHGSIEAMIISRISDALIIDVNEAYLGLTGYTREELIGQSTLALGLIPDPEGRMRRLAETRRLGQLRDAPTPVRTRSGEIRHCLQTGFLITLDGEDTGVSILRDMTEARQREQALAESEAKFSAAFHGSPLAMVITRLDNGRVIDMNAAHERLTGYSRERLVGESPLELGVVVDLDLRARLVAEVRAKGSIYDVEMGMRRLTGEIRECLQSSFAVEVAGEACMVSILRDVTDTRRAERALRQSETRLKQAVRVADIGIFDHDHVTGHYYWSSELRRIYGFSPDEPVTLEKILDSVHPSDVERTRREIERARDPAGDGRYDSEKRIRRRDGEIRWVATRAQAVFEGEGPDRRVARTVGAVIDFTERRASDEAIRRSEALLAEAQRTAHLGNFERDFLTGRARWSDEVYHLLGCEPGAYPAAFQTLIRFTHPDDRGALEAEYLRAFDPDHGGFFDTEHRILTPEGDLRVLHHRAQVTFDEIGRPVRVFGTVQDVTERRQLESELRRLNQELEQRVAARTAELEQVNRDLESFSYSVSHDLRAPLRHVQGYINLFERSLPAPLDKASAERLALIADAARRMGTLIDSLLAFSRIGRAAMRFSPVDLDAMLREVVSELQPDVEGRDIEWRIAALPTVAADRNLLRLVLTNLVSNAVKFTRTRERAVIEIGSDFVGGEWVVHVRDNGVGFDMQYVGKLFGVFQRLHSASDFPGTGIGLANCRRIVERHGGRIWIESEEGAGTTVRFTLPETQGGGG